MSTGDPRDTNITTEITTITTDGAGDIKLDDADLTAAAGLANMSITTTAGSSLSGILPSIPGLTSEEQKELDNLKAERDRGKKQAKLNKLKSYPSDVREKLTEMLRLKEAIEDINNTEANKSPREVELEAKNNNMLFSSGFGTIFLNTSIFPQISELTYEDIANAHAEQTLEEEISTQP